VAATEPRLPTFANPLCIIRQGRKLQRDVGSRRSCGRALLPSRPHYAPQLELGNDNESGFSIG
jgi:hypothetical protein